MKKKYMVLLIEREDWKNPQMIQVDANTEDEAFTAFCVKEEYEESFVDNGLETGEIMLHYKEVV